jgi:hypothetical protein
MQDNSAVLNDAGSPLIRARLRTPRAAAIARIALSVLLISSLWLLRPAVPSDPLESGAWLETSTERVSFVPNLVPIAGIAFMWFLGVLRNRLGKLEDQFFATVFLGSIGDEPGSFLSACYARLHAGNMPSPAVMSASEK